MEDLRYFQAKRRCTLLGVGPMSVNCVDATIELANQHKVPIMLIASRRQVDSVEMGGGYVNNWDTKSFAEYVRRRDKGRHIVLARDHGGPWQNSNEVENDLGLEEAMKSAEKSFEEDLNSDFDFIHIDPSIDPNGTPSQEDALKRLFRLYAFCNEKALSLGKKVIFEIGTEEQSGSTNTPSELTYTLEQVTEHCKNFKYQMPSFVVIQSGTKVMETRNVGAFHSPVRVKSQLPIQLQVPMMIEICNNFGLMMKAHNCDYLSWEALSWHPRLGINAVNIAPEYGVTETKALLGLLRSNSMEDLADDFLSHSFNSKKWSKWMFKDSDATDEDKAIISGHYVFASNKVKDILEVARRNLSGKGVELDDVLKNAVKEVVLFHLRALKVI